MMRSILVDAERIDATAVRFTGGVLTGEKSNAGKGRELLPANSSQQIAVDPR
jgi:hypothetical protein